MKQFVIAAVLCGTVISASAASEGVKAVVERRQNMRHIERPVRSIKQGDAIVSVYADDTIKTNAVRMMRMSESTKAKVAALVDDKETLAAARKLAKKIKEKHPKDAEGASDAELVGAADEVLDTSKKDQAAAGVIGAAVAAAVAALKKGKGKDKDKEGKVKA